MHFILLSQEKNKAGDILGNTEKTTTDKKRERRKKKKLKRLKIQEREKRQKLKEAMKGGDMKKKSKTEVEQTLKKLTKGGKAKILTVSNLVKCSINESSYIVVLFVYNFFTPVHFDRMTAWTRPCVPLRLSSLNCKTKSRAKSRARRTRRQRRRNKKRFLHTSLSCNADLFQKQYVQLLVL